MRALALALLALLAGCNKATELLVVFSSSVDPSKHPYDSLVVNVTDVDTGKASFSNTYSLASEGALPASLELHADDGTPTVQIDAELTLGTELIVERRAQLSFVSDRSLELRVDFVDSCAGTVCGPGLTCLSNHTCSPDAIDATTLPSISKDPIAAIDMASTDLAEPDLAAADMGGCPAIPAPPMLDPASSSCMTFTFDSLPAAGDPSFTIPAGFTVTPACGGLHIQLDGEPHPYGMQFRFQPPEVMDTDLWYIAAGYYAQTEGYAWAGIISDDGKGNWWRIATGEYDASDYDKYQLWDSEVASPAEYESTTMGVHTLDVTRTSTSSWSADIDDAPAGLPETVSTPLSSQRPAFFVGSESNSTISNSSAMDVYLRWVVACRSAP